MTPQEKENAERLLAIAGGRVDAGKWPPAIAGGTCITTEAQWRAAVELPGQHASLETQLREICVRASRQHFREHPPQEDSEAGAAGGDQVRELEARAGDVQWPIDRDDVVLAVADSWPFLALPDGRVLDGEASWRAALQSATGPELLEIWNTLRSSGAA